VPACYFDLDGTLVEHDAPFEEIFAAALDRLGVDDHGRRECEAYSEAFFDLLGEADDPFAAGIARTDVAVDPDAFSEALVVAESERTSAVDGASDVLDAVGAEYRLGLLTNGVGAAQRAKLDAVGLGDRFETVVVSGEVGVRKPEAGIYRVAEERLPADGYAFVADDLARDVRPAVERGWRGVHVEEREGESGSSPEGSGVAAVGSLHVVPEALGVR
jgi:HAD superfamily hydrolase (TIGR01549 family)